MCAKSMWKKCWGVGGWKDRGFRSVETKKPETPRSSSLVSRVTALALLLLSYNRLVRFVQESRIE